MVLVPTANIALDALAQLADKVAEMTSPTISTSASHIQTVEATHSSVEESSVRDMQKLRDDINQLKLQIAALATATPSRGRQRSLSRSTQASRSDSPAGSPTPGLCWYHWRFGTRAQKCHAPC
ncbi:unnamed protein product, partial [Ixodes hexagonus]